MKKPRFYVGYQFILYSMRKAKNVYTIKDILTTTNLAGDVVNVEYVCEHKFCGQPITTHQIDTSIARSEPVGINSINHHKTLFKSC